MENLYLAQVQPEEDYPFTMLVRANNSVEVELYINEYADNKELGVLQLLNVILIDIHQENKILTVL